MIHKIIPILVGLFICFCSLPALAAEYGSIEVSLPKDMEGEIIQFTKEGKEIQNITVDQNGIAKIEHLSVGTYQINVPETSGYTFVQAHVSIPTWSEEEQKMLYDVTVIPKYTQKEKPIAIKETGTPLTGDRHGGNTYINLSIISLIILVIMSCHNRFNCDTMTGKYSKTEDKSNGNDNDTENPRCTRRIGLGSPGSID